MPTEQAKRVLIVLGHPDADSYNAVLCQEYAAAARTAGHQVEVLELGKESFDPVLRFGYRQRMAPDPFIVRSQNLVTWADHLVLIFPVWWSQLPALLSGWLDRVFTPGFAFNYGPSMNPVRLLEGRSATLVMTSRAPSWILGAAGVSLKRLAKRLILGYCGIKPVRVLALGRIGNKGDSLARRATFIEKVRRHAGGAIPGTAEPAKQLESAS